jgi:hypothetical protein
VDVADLRHTAAYRMARDPQLPLTDAQWVLGRAHLSTTQLYLTPGDVIAGMLAHHHHHHHHHHHRRREATEATPVDGPPAAADPATPPSEYRPGWLAVLFGGQSS